MNVLLLEINVLLISEQREVMFDRLNHNFEWEN